VVDEHEVERAGGEAVLGLQPGDSLAVIAERADDDRDLVGHPACSRIRRAIAALAALNSTEYSPSSGSKRAMPSALYVTDVGAERAPRLHALDRLLEDRGLLVADVDQVLVLGS
jgi:hypothetical protein